MRKSYEYKSDYEDTFSKAEELHWQLKIQLEQFKKQWAFSFLGGSVSSAVGLAFLVCALLFQSAIPWDELAVTKSNVSLVVGIIIGFGLSIFIFGIMSLTQCYFARTSMREGHLAVEHLKQMLKHEADLAL